MSKTESDFLVIGAGIAGLAVASELAQHGSVSLLEMEAQHGYHTTGRTAAVFLDFYGNEVVQKLTAASRPFVESPPEGYFDAKVLRPLGGIFVAPRGHESDIEQVRQFAAAQAPDVRELSVDEAVAMVPFLSRDFLGAAAYDPRVGAFDVDALQQGYLNSMKAHGGQFYANNKVTAIHRAAGKWNVETNRGQFVSPRVVNAAGAWADEIAVMAGVGPVGLVPKRRTVVVFEAPDGMPVGDWPIVGDIAESFFFRTQAGMILASPCDQTPMPPSDAEADDSDVALVASRMKTVSGKPIGRVHRKWAGLRNFVADESPVLGRDETAKGFYWCAALGGFGIQTSPAIARIVAEQAAGSRSGEVLAEMGLAEDDVGPHRFRQSAECFVTAKN